MAMDATDEEKLTIKSRNDFRLKLWKMRYQSGDVIIICGKNERKLRAHKIVLAAASWFFAETFQDSNEVRLLDIDASDVEHIIEFVYTGQVTILDKNKEHFISTAQKLKIEGAPKAIPKLMPEILIKIFGNLPTFDLMKNIALVSKQFCELTKDFQVPLTCEIGTTSSERQTGYIEGMLTRAHQIKKLHFGKLAEAHQLSLVTASIKSMKNLEVLRSDICRPSDEINFDEAFKFLPLKVFICCFGMQDISKIGHCKTLEHIKIHCKTLPEFLALSSLTRLKTMQCNLGRGEIAKIKDIERVFSHLTQLVQLSLGTDFMQATVDHLCAFAKASSNLKNIVIFTNQLHPSYTHEKLNEFFENHKNIGNLMLVIFIPHNETLQPHQAFRQEDFSNIKLSIKNQRFQHANPFARHFISFIRRQIN